MGRLEKRLRTSTKSSDVSERFSNANETSSSPHYRHIVTGLSAAAYIGLLRGYFPSGENRTERATNGSELSPVVRIHGGVYRGIDGRGEHPDHR